VTAIAIPDTSNHVKNIGRRAYGATKLTARWTKTITKGGKNPPSTNFVPTSSE
jgi:hypothetical protein